MTSLEGSNRLGLTTEGQPRQPQRSTDDLSDEPRRHFECVISVRWTAVLGQLATIFVVRAALGVELPLVALLAIVAVELTINLFMQAWVQTNPIVRPSMVAGSVAVDVLLFTGLLYYTGGPFNPFVVLYLVHIGLALLILPTQLAQRVVVLALACFTALFAQHRWLGIGWDPRAPGHVRALDLHSQGTWTAFGIAALFIFCFARVVQRDLARRERAALDARERARRNEWLGSLAALTAGAAHELSSPLSTIAVAAKELEREITRGDSAMILLADVRLIRLEVQRCRAVLLQMLEDAGAADGEAFQDITVGALLARLHDELGRRRGLRMTIDPSLSTRTIRLPVRATLLALRNVVTNGWQAMAPGGEVVIHAGARDDRLAITIEDSGSGMKPEVLARAIEPLFTTKAPGANLGLGLFLTRTVLERVGGALTLVSAPGRGTIAVIDLPFA